MEEGFGIGDPVTADLIMPDGKCAVSGFKGFITTERGEYSNFYNQYVCYCPFPKGNHVQFVAYWQHTKLRRIALIEKMTHKNVRINEGIEFCRQSYLKD